MGIKEIRDDILKEKKKEATKILDEGKAEIEKIQKSMSSKVEALKAKFSEDEEKIISDYEKKQLATAKFQVNRMRFNLEKRLMDEVVADGRDLLTRTSDATKKRQFESILPKLGRNIDISQVYCSKKDVPLIKQYKAIPADILGGIIVENSEGDERIDFSYDTVLKEVVEKDYPKIMKLLFE
jgi:V/A-type H+/Na+-transporting ATPase subunit E